MAGSSGGRFSSLGRLVRLFPCLLSPALTLSTVLKTEAYLLVGILFYVAFVYIGASINASKAKSWHVFLVDASGALLTYPLSGSKHIFPSTNSNSLNPNLKLALYQMVIRTSSPSLPDAATLLLCTLFLPSSHVMIFSSGHSKPVGRLSTCTIVPLTTSNSTSNSLLVLLLTALSGLLSQRMNSSR